MFFKKIRGLSAVLLSLSLSLSLSVAGCARKGLPSSAGGLSIGGAESGCLSKTGAITTRYLNGQANELEISDAWNCAIHSLELFSTRTQGDKVGMYTPYELRSFLEFYFLDGAKISDGLLHEAMELKRVLIGGSTGMLTLKEIETAKTLLGTFRASSLKLRTHMPLDADLLSMKTDTQIKASLLALEGAARDIGAALEATGTPYSFERLNTLIGEMERFLTAPPAALAFLRKQVGALPAIKAMFIAPDGDRIAGYEWATVLTVAARWYGLLVRFEAAQSHLDSWFNSPGRERLMEVGRDAFALLDEAVARHPRSQISFGEFDALLDAVVPGGVELAGGKIPVGHLKDVLRVIVQRYMGGLELGSTGRTADGLTRPALARAWDQIYHWSEGQRYIEAMFNEARIMGGAGAESMNDFASELLISLTPQQVFARGSVTPALEVAAGKIQKILAGDRPLFSGDDDAITFISAKAPRRHSYQNLTKMNWMYELAAILIQSYGDGQKEQVTFVEFKHFNDDLHDIMDDTRYIDPKDEKLSEKRFREASLFTFAGNGDAFMSLQEAAQLLALIYSGKGLSTDLHEKVLKSGCGYYPAKFDPWGRELMEAQCYRNQLFDHVDYYWRHSPGLMTYFKGLTDWQREDFKHTMEDAARKRGYSADSMNSSDSEGFAMIAQYIEVLFSRYDTDQSGALDWSEAEVAFPVFKATLAQLSCQLGSFLSSDADLRAVFTYMLAHGEPPSKAAFLRWRYFPFFRNLYSDRGRIMHIFAVLSKSR